MATSRLVQLVTGTAHPPYVHAISLSLISFSPFGWSENRSTNGRQVIYALSCDFSELINYPHSRSDRFKCVRRIRRGVPIMALPPYYHRVVFDHDWMGSCH